MLKTSALPVDYDKKNTFFVYARDIQYTPEELLGMMLNYSCGLAQDFAGQSTRRQARRHVAHSSLGKQNFSSFFSLCVLLPIF